MYLPHRTGEEKRMVHHHDELVAFRELNKFLSMISARSEWLLDEYMFTVLQRRFGELVMTPDWRDDGYHIDLGRTEKLLFIGGDLRPGANLFCAAECLQASVADGNDLEPLRQAKVPNDIRAPISVSNNAYSNHWLCLF